MEVSFGSACHGAGRTMSRHELGHRGGVAGVDEPDAGGAVAAGGVQVKEDIDSVVETVSAAGLASKVARLRPIAVMHG